MRSKRMMLLAVPLGAVVVLVAFSARNEGMAQAGGGTKLYASDGRDVKIQADAKGFLYATGALGTARAEVFSGPAVTKEIGCFIEGNGTGGAMVTCTAVSGVKTLRCVAAATTFSTTEPQGNSYATILSLMNSDSYIQFNTDMNAGAGSSVTGNCTFIHVENSSKFYPSQP